MGGALYPLCEKCDGLGSFVLLVEAVGLPIEESAEGWGVLVSLGSASKVLFGLEGSFLDAKQPTAPDLGCVLSDRRGLKEERSQEGIGFLALSANEQGACEADLFVVCQWALAAEGLEREEIAVSLKKSVESLQVGGFSVVSLNASDLLAFCVEQEKGGEIEDRVTSCDLLSLGCIKVEADTDRALEKRQSGGCIEDFAVELVAGGTPRRRDLHKKREAIRSVALCKGEIALYPSDRTSVHRRRQSK